MTDPLITRLENAKRPKLLMRAAKYACSYYRRETDLDRLLDRLLGAERTHSQTDIVERLMDKENDLNDKRHLNDASYVVTDHVTCLAALISESITMIGQDRVAS